MLLRFEMENFRSFAGEAALSMRAGAVREHSGHVVSMGSSRVLPVAAIFGANASGKSNVLLGLTAMADCVARSFAACFGWRPYAPPFQFSAEGRGGSTRFAAAFVSDAEDGFRTYDYTFTVQGPQILDERLTVRSRTARTGREVFARDGGGILHMDGLDARARDVLELADVDGALVVSASHRFNIPILERVYNWFNGIISTEVSQSPLLSDFGRDVAARTQMVASEENARAVHRYLSSFDPGIYDIKPVRVERDDRTGADRIYTTHVGMDGVRASIPLEDESAGTQKMIGLYPFLERALSTGGILIADEMTSMLHPDLIASLINAFTDPELNPRHAQLLFATQNVSILGMDLLRRDEIWFAEKKDGVSTLAGLRDMVVRSTGGKARADYNHEINYMRGNYGAKPNISRLTFVKPDKDT